MIDKWMHGSDSQLPLTGEARDVIGHVLVRDTGELIESKHVRVLLVRDGSMPDGWRIKTAYADVVKGGHHG